jgi:hypothetical protein
MSDDDDREWFADKVEDEMERLLERISNLVTELQKEVAELKQDRLRRVREHVLGPLIGPRPSSWGKDWKPKTPDVTIKTKDNQFCMCRECGATLLPADGYFCSRSCEVKYHGT